jgi:hypothetical protein
MTNKEKAIKKLGENTIIAISKANSELQGIALQLTINGMIGVYYASVSLITSQLEESLEEHY